MKDLLLLGAAAFAGGFALRAVDPVVLQIAAHFQVPVATAALLASAYAIPYALAQLALGSLGDRFGKARLVRVCVAGLALALAAGAVAPTFPLLVATRIAAGVFGGGLVPLALASVGDRVPLAGRHVAVARMLILVISGQMLGSALAGLVGGAAGWVAVLVLAAAVAAVAAALVWAGLAVEPPAAAGTASPSIASLYRTLFANPLTLWVYGAVFVEGILFYGLFPWMGELLVGRGAATPASAPATAGLVLGAFGVGGIAFAVVAGRLVPALGSRRLCTAGAVAATAGLLAVAVAPGWAVAAVAMAVTGFAFYMVHSTLQTEATELAPAARGTGFALFAGAFFTGQGVGPALVGAGLHSAGPVPTLVAIAAAMAVLGAVVVRRIVGASRA
jgi:DHA1 family inner membrane transport protein